MNLVHGLWYALYVKPRYEMRIEQVLCAKGYDVFVPRQRQVGSVVRDRVSREKPLFSRYVFCRFNQMLRFPLTTTEGVLRVVGTGHTPAPIPDEEISAISAVEHSGVPYYAYQHIQRGSRVRVIVGALTGITGIVLSYSRKSRLYIVVEAVNHSISVEIEESWIQAA